MTRFACIAFAVVAASVLGCDDLTTEEKCREVCALDCLDQSCDHCIQFRPGLPCLEESDAVFECMLESDEDDLCRGESGDCRFPIARLSLCLGPRE